MIATSLNLLKRLSDGKPYTGTLDTFAERCVDARTLETRILEMKDAGHVGLRDISIEGDLVHVTELIATMEGLEVLRRHHP